MEIKNVSMELQKGVRYLNAKMNESQLRLKKALFKLRKKLRA